MASLPTHLLHISRWLQKRAILLEPEQTGIQEGGRAVIAVALIVLLGHVSHYPELTWAAFGAFWTCLVDPGGSARRRLRAMALFAGSGTVATMLGAYFGRAGLLPSTAALMMLVFVGGLYRIFGPGAAQAGILASVAADVAVDYPGPLLRDMGLAAVFLAGCLWAVFACLFLWRIHPFQPARRAVSALYRDLGIMCTDLEATCGIVRGGVRRPDCGTHRWAVRRAIERCRTLLDRLAADCRDLRSRHLLLSAVETGDRIFAGLIAVESDLSCRPSEFRRIRLSALLGELAKALDEIGRRVMDPDPRPGPLEMSARCLGTYATSPHPLDARIALLMSEAIAGLAHCWTTREGLDRDASAVMAQVADKATRRSAWRHAARVAVTVAVARMAASHIGLPYGYWATVAVVVVMQPQIDENWPRLIERALGSMLGGLLAAFLWKVLPTPSFILLAVFPLVAATIAFRSVNYTLFVVFLSALFVLVADLGAPANGEGIALARACNNMLGSLLSLAGGLLLWRDRPKVRFEQVLAEAVEANVDYLMQVLSGSDGSDRLLDAARRRAGICSNAAEIALHRRLLEGRRDVARCGRTASLLAELRELAGAATAAWLAGEIDGKNADLIAWCQALRHDLSLIVREGSGAISGTVPKLPAARISRAVAGVVAQINLYAGETA